MAKDTPGITPPPLPAPEGGTVPQWWLANGGTSSGPYPESEVVTRLIAGHLRHDQWACPVGDTVWRPVSEWPALQKHLVASPVGGVPVDAREDAPGTAAPAERPASDLQKWLLTSTIVGCIVAALLTVRFTFPPAGSKVVPVGQIMQQPGVSAPAANPAAQTTYAYWSRISQTIQPLAQLDTQHASSAGQVFGQLAAQLKALPTLGVDLDAVDSALALARAFDAMATFLATSNSPAMLVEAFLRGYQGDTFGTYNELRATHRQIGDQMRGAANRCDEARALLTARYGIEFPPL